MKNKTLKYLLITGFSFFLIAACSTKKNSFVSRNSHALSSEYNILYNGGIALDVGINELKSSYKDNFWERLPIERMQISEEALLPGQAKNVNFDRAETKAIKAIQKHSMNIAGTEKNPQMDEAHLILGKARYYDQRFIPALEAFNYILYKYPSSDKIYEAKIWREKTNIRMEREALAVNNLRRLLKDIKFKDQIFADANAILAQAYLNLEVKDSALIKLKLATKFTKVKEEKARYRFILAQIYEELSYKDSAYVTYQSVIDRKRKSPRQYVIQSHARQAQQFDFEKGDTIVFLKKFDKLLKDRENRPFLDVLNHQMGLFYEKNKKPQIAIQYYNKSIKAKSQDTYLIASNYRNLAEIYFDKAKYLKAGQYFDSTLVQLNAKSREYKFIKKKSENLVDVIKFEEIARRNDSILNVVSLSEIDRVVFYENYIAKLKKEEEVQKALLKKAKPTVITPDETDMDMKAGAFSPDGPMMMPQAKNSEVDNFTKTSDFYFYNANTLAFGKEQFKKNWGDRAYKNNWRLVASKSDMDAEIIESDNKTPAEAENEKAPLVEEKYTTTFYLEQLPKQQIALDSIAKERNFAYYQLGVIYKENFKDYPLAASKLEKLLKDNPEERLVLPAMYNLYKIYEVIDKDKALAIKTSMVTQYPESHYAQILNHTNSETLATVKTPEKTYTELFKCFEAGDYRTAYTEVDLAIGQYTGDEMIPKFELLKADITGKLKGILEYNKALNFVSMRYPYYDEGKQAEVILGKNTALLAQLKFNAETPKSWKILYKVGYNEVKTTKVLLDKIRKFILDRPFDKLSVSNDVFDMTDNFIVIHGVISEKYATELVKTLKNHKDYTITLNPVVISNYNYKVVQMKKNMDDYLALPPVVIPTHTEIPTQNQSDVPEVAPTEQGSQVLESDVPEMVPTEEGSQAPESEEHESPTNPNLQTEKP